MRAIIAAMLVVGMLWDLRAGGPDLWATVLARLLASVGMASAYLYFVRAIAERRWLAASSAAESKKFRLDVGGELIRARMSKVGTEPPKGKRPVSADEVIYGLDYIRAEQRCAESWLRRSETEYRHRYMFSAVAAAAVGLLGLLFPETVFPIAAAAIISLWRPWLALQAHAAAAAAIVCWHGGMPMPVAALLPAAVLADRYSAGSINGAYLLYAVYGTGALVMILGIEWWIAAIAAISVSAITAMVISMTSTKQIVATTVIP